MSLWTTVKQTNVQICVAHCPFAYIFVKGNVCKKGCGHSTFSSTIVIIREVQYLQGFDIRQRTAPLKHDRLQSHKGTILHQNCLPQR